LIPEKETAECRKQKNYATHRAKKQKQSTYNKQQPLASIGKDGS
jgi:3-phenylpropionate/cinnamic acid dioxygenase small subunit